MKTITEKACGCEKIVEYPKCEERNSPYDEVHFCDFHQFMFDKEVKEWRNDEENEFPDDIEFFYREESLPSFYTKQEKAIQTD